MISGPIAMTSSKRSPLSSSFLSGAVTLPCSPREPSSVISVKCSEQALNSSSRMTRSLLRKPTIDGDLGAELGAALGDRQRDGAADAAADHADLLEAVEVAGRAERADEIGQAVALVQVVQLLQSSRRRSGR